MVADLVMGISLPVSVMGDRIGGSLKPGALKPVGVVALWSLMPCGVYHGYQYSRK